MKLIVRIALLALAVAALAFGLTAWFARPAANANSDEMVWLKAEFHLTAAQAAAIGTLQDDYNPVCMEHCRLIREARSRLHHLDTAGKRDSAGYAAAQTEMARLNQVCQQATRSHLEKIAAVMSPDEGARFLALTTPKVSTQSHAAPLDLR